MEMQSGELCVCLDKDRKSLYACAFASKYLWRKKSKILFLLYDVKNGIKDLLRQIKLASELPVVVLIQHPSPSTLDKNMAILKSTIHQCITAKEMNYVDSIHFVYNTNSGSTGTSWNEKKLFNMVKPMCENEAHQLIEPFVISEKGDAAVKHQIFGHTDRRGWAKLKGGEEMSFGILRTE